jgi:CheY-like chemotaxis protein
MWKTILVVEDNEYCRELTAIQLRKMGYQVIEAATGEEGIQKTREGSPDLILMDLWLSGISGIETTIEIKKNKKTSHIPIVAYTAWQEEVYKELAKKAGIEAFLIKPTSFQHFKNFIEGILRAKTFNQGALEPTSN